MRDFTRQTYRALLQALKQSGIDYVLRHDVDKRPRHSLAFAQIEREEGVQAVYYFRCVPESNDPAVIEQIAALGHEIGYHYEDMSLCHGDTQAAIRHFEQWLTYFRKFYPVHRICMHGAPTSQYDGRDLWKTYDYHAYGVDYEPYFDEDFQTTFYLTDTGRRWDGFRTSVRDKVPQQKIWCRQGLVFHTTYDIIAWLQSGQWQSGAAPVQRIMLTTHPQRWTDNMGEWLQEKFIQTVKNAIKMVLICVRK